VHKPIHLLLGALEVVDGKGICGNDLDVKRRAYLQDLSRARGEVEEFAKIK
jgi:hypothetical protein